MALAGLALGACGGDDPAVGEAEVSVAVVDGSDDGDSDGAASDGAAGSDDDDRGAAEGSTGTGDTDGENGASGATGVTPLNCDGSAPSSYEAEVSADVATIGTDELVTGVIEPFTVDNWQIELCEGEVVYFDHHNTNCDGDGDLRWRLIDPSGASDTTLGRIISSNGDCMNEAGRREISETGIHTIEVYYDGTADQQADHYEFEVISVRPSDVLDIAVGDSIAPGVPAEGAGAIETPGSRDRYQLELSDGDRVYFKNSETCDGADGDLRWQLILPDGEIEHLGRITSTNGSCLQERDPIDITQSGTHVLEVYYGDTDPGTARGYEVAVVDASGG